MRSQPALSIVLTTVGLPLAGLVKVSFFELLAAAALASLAVPLVALGYTVYLDNKVQAGSGSEAWSRPSTTRCGCSGAPPTADPSGG